MPTPIETGYIQTFGRNLTMLLQQRGSRLRNAVTEETVVGEIAYFDQIGPVEALERTGEFTDLEPTQSPLLRRRVTFAERYRAEYVGEMSKLRMIADPTSAYAENSLHALNRAIDQVIVEAAFGTAWTGKDGTVPVNFPAGQILAPAGSGLTLAKLIEAREKLDAAENDPADQRAIVVSARQISDLLRTTEATSADYTTVKALVAGQIDTFMGFRFLRYEGLPLVSGTTRRVFAMVKSGIKLGIARDITTSADWIPAKRAWLLYAGIALGATRMQENKLVAIDCQE